MLYPRENLVDNTLDFACRTCHFTEKASTSCVFRNELRNTVGETAGITQDVSQDPTVNELSFDLPEMCTYCGNEICCTICGEPTDRGLFLEVPDDDHDNDEKAGTGLRTPVSQSATSAQEEELHASQQLKALRLDPEASQEEQQHLGAQRPSS